MSFTSVLAGNIVYRGLNILVGFVIMLLLTRMMGTEGFGLLSLVIANVTLFNLLSCLGAESSVIYHGASRKLPAGKILTLIYGVFLFQLILLVIVELIGHAITGNYWLVRGEGLTQLFMGIVFLIGITLADKYTALLYGRHLYTLANGIIFLGNAVALGVFLAYYFSHTERNPSFYLGLYIATILGQAILLIISYHLFSKERTAFGKVDKKDIKVFFNYSILVFFTNLVQFLAYRVDYWLVDHYKGESSLGIYALAIRLNQFTWVIPILAASIIFPLVADKEKSFDENKLLSLLRLINTLLLFSSCIVFFIAPFLIPVFFGEAFRDSIRPFQLLVPGFYLFIITIVLAAWYAGKGNLMINLLGSLFCFLLVLSLDLWLIPSRGVTGAAIASSIAYGATALYYVIRFCLSTRRSPLELFVIRGKDWKIMKEMYSQTLKRKS